MTPHTMRIVFDVAHSHHRSADTEGFDGYAGGFMRALCEAVFKADRVNRAKLRVVFPDLVDAVDYYETRPIERSRELAEWVDQ